MTDSHQEFQWESYVSTPRKRFKSPAVWHSRDFGSKDDIVVELRRRHVDPERRRHLLRLWLMEDERPAAEGVRLHKGAGGIPRREGKGTYYSGRKVS